VTLALVALIPLPILAAGALWYTLTAHRRYRAQRQAASAMNALLMDNLQGVRQVKAFGREPHEDKRFAQRADDLRKGTLGIMRVWAAYSPAMSFAGALGLTLVLWVGGRQVLADRITLGQLVGFVFYLGLFYEPLARLHGLNQMLQAARAAGERVFDILDAPVERHPRAEGKELMPPQRSNENAARRHRGEVVYEHVGFSYSEERVVLRNISLHARPGEMVALVGPTGAGKSTLVNLLPAFYESSSGRILIDGDDIKDVSLADLRGRISVVSQEAFLFNGTIRENIFYGRLNATEQEMLAASKAANCHDFISHLRVTTHELASEGSS
jgi:ABC-type multidrug transport system fused ATPase/permease subunit